MKVLKVFETKNVPAAAGCQNNIEIQIQLTGNTQFAKEFLKSQANLLVDQLNDESTNGQTWLLVKNFLALQGPIDKEVLSVSLNSIHTKN